MSAPLPLDSPIWLTLSHAYGSAEDLPELLAALYEKTAAIGKHKEITLSDYWSCLYHQEDIYDGSIAAFPHLVEIAARIDPVSRTELLFLAAAIASADDDLLSSLKPEIQNAFYAYKEKGLALLSESFVASPETTGIRYWLGSLSAFKGKNDIARFLFSLDSFVDAYLTRDFSFPVEDKLLADIRT